MTNLRETMQYGRERDTVGRSPFGYSDAASFVEGMKKQGVGEYGKIPSYWRSGHERLYLLEEHLKGVFGLKPTDKLLLTTSGQAATALALELAAPSRGDIVPYSAVTYGKTDDYIMKDLVERGVIPIKIDTGNVAAINEAFHNIKDSYPDARIAAFLIESVGNGPDMHVANLPLIFSLPIMRQVGYVIVDNTLPTDVVYPSITQSRAHPDLPIIFAMSTTKIPLRNTDTEGAVITLNPDIGEMLLQKRTRMGTTPGPSLVEKSELYVPANREQYEWEVQRIAANTLILARACAYASGAGERFRVSHPNLADHPNSLLAHKLAPDGITPVFFITPTEQSGISAEELFYFLENNGAIGEDVGVILSESFGFDETGASHSTREGGYVRIAGGLENQEVVAVIAQRLHNALSAV